MDPPAAAPGPESSAPSVDGRAGAGAILPRGGAVAGLVASAGLCPGAPAAAARARSAVGADVGGWPAVPGRPARTGPSAGPAAPAGAAARPVGVATPGSRRPRPDRCPAAAAPTRTRSPHPRTPTEPARAVPHRPGSPGGVDVPRAHQPTRAWCRAAGHWTAPSTQVAPESGPLCGTAGPALDVLPGASPPRTASGGPATSSSGCPGPEPRRAPARARRHPLTKAQPPTWPLTRARAAASRVPGGSGSSPSPAGCPPGPLSPGP